MAKTKKVTDNSSAAPNLQKLRAKMEKALKPDRFEHTLGVAFTAAAMAMRYGADVTKAQTAGMLHDCAKNISHDEKFQICQKNHIPVTPSEKANPVLLHAKVGAFLAETKYGIKDPEILDAITYHTTGRPNMTLLDKIIYIADFIEPARNSAPNLPAIRELAFQDIDACLCSILESTLKYLEDTNAAADDMTARTYAYYKGEV